MKLIQVLRARAATARPGGEGKKAATGGERGRKTVSVREAKDGLSALLQRAAIGEEIVITSDGKPKAMLVRFRPVVGGKPWQSLAAFRATMPMTPDSTPMIRRMRDSGY